MKTGPDAGTLFQIALRRPRQAPQAPQGQDLKRLFFIAWSLIPGKRKGVAAKASRLSVNVHYLDDPEMAQLNGHHLGHEGPTDVLSFPILESDPERKSFHLGEILIGFRMAEREACARRLPLYEEMSRYAVHGFLHLLGYEDGTPAKRKGMQKIQEAALERFFKVGASREK